MTDDAGQPESDLSRLRALLEHAPDGIFIADLEGRYTDVNRAGCAMLGYSRDEIIGKTILDLIPPQDAERLWESREQLLAGGVQVADWELRRRDGSYLPVEVSARILPDGRWQGFVRDITERKRLEAVTEDHRRAREALRLSEEQLKLSLQASPVVVFQQDEDLRYTWIHNARAPFAADEVIGKTDFDLLPNHQAERLTELKRGVLTSGKGTRAVVSTTVGSEQLYFDLAVEPLRDATGRVIGVSCASWDISDQRRAEQEQRLLARFGAVLMKAAPDEDATLTELGDLAVRELADWFLIDLVQDGAVRRLGLACRDPKHRPLADALGALQLDRNRPHLMAEAVRAGRSTLVTRVTPDYLESIAQSPEHLRLLQALELRSFLAMPLVVRGRLLGAFALLSSRDSRSYGERDLRFAEELARVAGLAVENARLYRAAKRAIAARDEVLSVVAHDLRNPLNSIVLALSLMSRGEEPERRDQGNIEKMKRAARRANRLIDDMLDVAQLDAGALKIKRQPVNLHSLLQEVCEAHRAAAADARLEIRLDVADALPPVSGDPDRILQVLDNLVGNATKFTPAGGVIVVGATPTQGEVVLRVTDTGVGIPPEHMVHLFDRFWQGTQASRRGAGLGLSIAKGIVEAHGGLIWAESENGRGTTFYFTLAALRATGHDRPLDQTRPPGHSRA